MCFCVFFSRILYNYTDLYHLKIKNKKKPGLKGAAQANTKNNWARQSHSKNKSNWSKTRGWQEMKGTSALDFLNKNSFCRFFLYFFKTCFFLFSIILYITPPEINLEVAHHPTWLCLSIWLCLSVIFLSELVLRDIFEVRSKKILV